MLKYIIVALSILMSSAFGQNNNIGGIYSYGSSAEHGPTGTVYIYPLSASSLLFYIDLNVGVPSYNMGSLFGKMSQQGKDGNFEMERDDQFPDCRLNFHFLKNNLVITHNPMEDCGFGHGVYASGTYKQVDTETPMFFEDGEGKKVSFENLFSKELSKGKKTKFSLEDLQGAWTEKQGENATFGIWGDTLIYTEYQEEVATISIVNDSLIIRIRGEVFAERIVKVSSDTLILQDEWSTSTYLKME